MENFQREIRELIVSEVDVREGGGREGVRFQKFAEEDGEREVPPGKEVARSDGD